MICESEILKWDKKRELKDRYNSTADLYDDRYEEIQRYKLEAIRGCLEESDRLLDVGCGTGALLTEFFEDKELALGVDLSLEMLKVAGKRVGSDRLVLADADMLPFEGGTFDLVVSLTLLQNMPEPVRTVREMARVAENGGKVALTTLEKKNSLHELRSWMSSANLKPLRSENIPESEDILAIGVREK